MLGWHPNFNILAPLPADKTYAAAASGQNATKSNEVRTKLPPTSDLKSTTSKRSPKLADHNERNYNIVIFGLPECPEGTPRGERVTKDEEAVVWSIHKQVPSFSSVSIRFNYRLGKYSASHHRPRPILATLSNVSDVSTILSKRFKTGSVQIKADLSPEIRRIQYILRNERRLLMDQDVADRRVIRIRGSGLYIGDRKYARALNDEFVKCDSLGDHVPVHSPLSHINTVSDFHDNPPTGDQPVEIAVDASNASSEHRD